MAAPAIPAYISAVTSSPAAALVTGEKGLSVPKVMTDNGAVAARAARPVAMAAAPGGGSQRRSPNSQAGPRAAIPATARYDNLNDRAWALCGQSATAITKTVDRVTSGFCGLSAAEAALAAQNINTARATDGEAPTRYRYRPASAQARVLARNGPSRKPSSSETNPASMPTC
ncbi:MAG: hypothetical protein A2Y38_10640 [Spirochaetes bacterium GWB1_59_5]|nr:MAG: hypothetical protein A2Y38_10640 [Spirochaetes bacterium GWB1_59_5]